MASTGDLLHKCFENILRNAIRHTASHSTVTASLHREGRKFLITIQDQGPGLPDTELERIFDEFYRVDEARQRESGGHGLGLSIARRAVELHGGEISAHNGRKGLCVRISLPASS